MPQIKSISIVGLGRLGLPIAAGFAAAGLRVIGIERRADIRRAVRAGRAPWLEPGLDALLRRGKRRFSVSAEFASVAETDATIVLVATPSLPSGAFSLRDVLSAVRGVGEELRRKKRPHLVVIGSTINPGDLTGRIAPALERAAGRPLGSHLGLCYNPEFFALGEIARQFRRPPLVLIGASDARHARRLAAVYRRICADAPAMHVTTPVNAELAKLALNAYIGAKISFANALAAVCNRLPGADVDAVTNVLGSDPRIGSRYLRGGPAFGGPCFPRDQRALRMLAGRLQLRSPVTDGVIAQNELQTKLLADLVCRYAARGGRVALLGLAFKPGTSCVAESPAVALARALARRGRHVRTYDAHADDVSALAGARGIERCDSMSTCLRRANVVVVATPWPAFAQLQSRHLLGASRRVVLVDLWRVLDPSRLGGRAYVAWGRAAHTT